MNIAELIRYQQDWEARRGIKNGHFGLERVQVEMDEAWQADSPEELLKEVIDVFIIAAGALGQLSEEVGKCPEQVETMLKDKIKLNEKKYPESVFREMEWQAAVTLCRALWNQGQPYPEPKDYTNKNDAT